MLQFCWLNYLNGYGTGKKIRPLDYRPTAFFSQFVRELLSYSSSVNSSGVSSEAVSNGINYLSDRVSVLYRSLSLVTT